MRFQPHRKEKIYFGIMVAVSLALYGFWIFTLIAAPHYRGLLVYAGYLGVLMLLSTVAHFFFMGYVLGNAVKITDRQFPEVFDIVQRQSQKLGLKKIPQVYVLQGNGVLNAFATRFARAHYVVLFSNVLEAAYQEGLPAIEFIVGHELGHIKKNHTGFWKRMLVLPASLIPFLSAAYSRACEYSCDKIGSNLAPHGAHKGLLILAAGTQLYKKIDLHEFVGNAYADSGFTTWLVECFASHPHLGKRLTALGGLHDFRVYPAHHAAKDSPLVPSDFEYDVAVDPREQSQQESER